MSVRENVTLAHSAQFVASRLLIDRRGSGRSPPSNTSSELRIRTPRAEQLVAIFRGGNQQKVVLAKWLLGEARVFLFDEPTRGIDVGAKAEIYDLMVKLAQNGAAIVMVSSELPEVLGMSHRILVMRDGRIVRELRASEATPRRRDRRRDGSRRLVEQARDASRSNRAGLKEDKARANAARIGCALAGAIALVGHASRFWSTSLRKGAFLEPDNIINVLRQITYGCILAVGETFVIITAGIDLSVGSLISLRGVRHGDVRELACTSAASR